MAFLLLVLAMGAAADYYMPQEPAQDLPMPTLPPSTPYQTYQPQPIPTLPPTVAPDVPSPPPYAPEPIPTLPPTVAPDVPSPPPYAPEPIPTLPPTVAPDVPSPPPSYQEYNYATYAPQPVPTLPPFVPDVRPCDVCPAVNINFNPALTRVANCRALGLDLADYEILSAMTVDTTTSSGQFGCWHDNVRSYLTTCQDGKFIDQDGDHIVSLVCLKKVDRFTPSQAQPQPYYTAAPQPIPTLPPMIITPAPDVPKANGYSGY
ncbi:hypothetical protein WR25_23125 [Diploscapter pachys]|uniref:Uncharacterized protein n=1 Tax=Diploscapter pachys TaxID=2018661 RepID=A0A2A2LX01_9BILA|nr:hypothetical protein WR25_23125 [Diploscapter pachys]